MKIDGKLVVVTGAASGLGAATADHLRSKDAKLCLIDHDADALAAVPVGDGAALPLDVTSSIDVENGLQAVFERLGPPAALINCAGIAPAKKIAGRNGPMPLADFERVISVNLVGSFNCMRIAVHWMKRCAPNADGGRGVVINTSSIAAFEGQAGQAAYAASKGGIAALTLPAARELAGDGIRVVAIAPGLFNTPLVTSMPEPVQASLASTIPFPNRLGHGHEFAALVGQIIENPMLNGTVIRLDGGLRMAAT